MHLVLRSPDITTSGAQHVATSLRLVREVSRKCAAPKLLSFNIKVVRQAGIHMVIIHRVLLKSHSFEIRAFFFIYTSGFLGVQVSLLNIYHNMLAFRDFNV